MKFLQVNRIVPDGTPRFAASHLGLFCLPMSIEKDVRLKWVNLVGWAPDSLSQGSEFESNQGCCAVCLS